MIILLSPSKTINPKDFNGSATAPEFILQSKQLVDAVRGLGQDLEKIFGVSESIAAQNRQQFKDWMPEGGTPAAWTYRGETFAGLSIEKMDEQEQDFAQEHLRIVSGLYGLLRPKDAIWPYRLEMGTRLSGKWGNNLYDFWDESLAEALAKKEPRFVLNCASNEYFKVVKKHLPKQLPVITPKFLHEGKSKMAFAKYSRGLMARWAITHQIDAAEQVLGFDAEGYVFDQKSDPHNPIFNAPADFSLKGRWTKL